MNHSDVVFGGPGPNRAERRDPYKVKVAEREAKRARKHSKTSGRFEAFALVNAHTGDVHSTHKTRDEARAALTASGDHALRVRGDKPRGAVV